MHSTESLVDDEGPSPSMSVASKQAKNAKNVKNADIDAEHASVSSTENVLSLTISKTLLHGQSHAKSFETRRLNMYSWTMQ